MNEPRVADTSKIGPYAVEREIGRGGMGVVYLARDPKLDRPIAIKLLPDEFTGDTHRRARLEREARILASLRHPNIAGIHSLEDSDGRLFLTLEFIPGDTLADRIARGPIPLEEALELCRQIAAGVEAAHDSGVVHRDLKPGNIKVTPAGEARVLDFGIAKDIQSSSGDAVLTQTPTLTQAGGLGPILGTAAYMSPEQARGRELDRRTDIWSFGCVLFECLTGQQAFGGATISDTIARILTREPDLATLPAATPPAVRELLQRCLAKDAKMRLRDIGEARIVLEQVLAARTSTGSWRPDAIRAGMASARRAPSWIPMALVAAGLAATAAWFAAKASAPPPTVRAVAVPMPPRFLVRGSFLSPDARNVFVSGLPRDDPSGQARLYVRPVGTYEFRPIAGTDGFTASYYSPNGREIAALIPTSPNSTERRILIFAVDGNAPATALAPWSNSWQSVAWTNGGDLLVMDGPTSLVRITRASGSVSPPRRLDLSGIAGVSRVDLANVLPGDRTAFVNVVAYDSRGWHYSVGALDLATAKVRVVIEDGGNAVYRPREKLLLFARGRTIFAVPFDARRMAAKGVPMPVWQGLRTNWDVAPGFFRVLDDGSLYHAPGGSQQGRQMAWMSAGGEITPWTGERKTFDGSPVAAPDGVRFVASIVNARGIDELWVGRLDQPTLRRITDDPGADCSEPRWSPDGARLAYRRNGGHDGRDGIYVIDAGGGTARRVLRDDSTDVTFRPAAWLPAGGLLVTKESGGRSVIGRLRETEREAAENDLVPVHANGNVRSLSFSPDGRRVAYVGDESGRFEAYVAAAPDGDRLSNPLQVSTAGAFFIAWSEGGRSVVYQDANTRVHRVPLSASGVPGTEVGAALDVQRLGLGSWLTLPDERFLVTLRSEDESDIAHYMLVENWMSHVQGVLRAGR